MKKLLISLIVFAMAVGVLSACGTSETAEVKGKAELSSTISVSSKSDESSNSSEASKESKEAEDSKQESSDKSSKPANSKEESTNGETSKEESTNEETSKEENTNEETSKEESSKEVNKNTESKPESSAVQKPYSRPTSSKPAEKSQPETTYKGSFSDKDAAVSYKGVTITLDAQFDPIASKIGTPDSKQENPNCLTGGVGYTYVYGNMTVNVYSDGGKEYVEDIMVDGSGSAKTSKGIAAGSSANDIKNSYGTAAQSDDMIVSYSTSNRTMMFYMENGKVTGFYITRNR